MSNLLVVDWDYFFANPMESGDTTDERFWLFDWGHQESVLMRDIIWGTRAPSFLKFGLELPGVTVPENWWDRFNIADDAVIEVSDSNMYSGLAGDGAEFEHVWLYDAHHDLYRIKTLADFRHYMDRGIITCEDWMFVHHGNESKLHWRWPQWHIGGKDVRKTIPKWVGCDARKDDMGKLDIEFDTVSICRSGSWVPPWCDEQFERFYLSCPGGEVIQVDDVDLKRDFDIEECREFAEKMKAMEAGARG